MRNNQDRFSLGQQQSFSNPVAQVAQPTFNFITPTELVELPSKGKYYPPEHPLHNKETVEIKHMTAKEEDILTNKSFIEKGIVLDKLLESVFVDKQIDPSSLFVIDKNAILLKSRITGYGSDYSAIVMCNTCGNKMQANVDLNNLLKIKEAELPEGAVQEQNGLVTVVLPISKWKVSLKPLNGYDQLEMQKSFELRKKHNLEENILLETLKSFIFSINDIQDPLSLQSAVVNMPARDSKYIRTIFAKCFPNITSQINVSCSSCSTEIETEVPFSINFFWPD